MEKSAKNFKIQMFQTDNNCLIILAENVAVINDDINISQEKVSK